MKNRVIRALLCGIAVVVGLIIVNLVKGQPLDWFKAFGGGVLMFVIDLIFSLIGSVINKIKTNK